MFAWHYSWMDRTPSIKPAWPWPCLMRTFMEHAIDQDMRCKDHVDNSHLVKIIGTICKISAFYNSRKFCNSIQIFRISAFASRRFGNAGLRWHNLTCSDLRLIKVTLNIRFIFKIYLKKYSKMAGGITQLASNKCFGGLQKIYSHDRFLFSTSVKQSRYNKWHIVITYNDIPACKIFFIFILYFI